MAAVRTVALVLLGALALVCGASAEVVKLTDENYEATVADPTKVFFIKYFAPWCGHCKRLAPTWEELSEEDMFKEIVIAHVDCTDSKDTCQKQEIRGYPTLKAIYKGEEYKAYQGPRDLASMRTFIQGVALETVHETAE